jgi:hypothetical protein
MKKKKALILFIFFDLLFLGGMVIFYNEIGRIILELKNQADMIKFGNRIGFFCLGFIIPIVHLLGIIDYFRPEYILKHKRFLNHTLIFLSIFILAASIFASSWIKVQIENAGYVYCRNASGLSALARTLVYTKDMATCEEQVALKTRRR